MYVAGIIPHKEPNLTELNHYLKPVIDDLEMSWKTGVHYSKTALYSSGRTVRCAIVAAVMDLLAARKASQLAPVTSHFYCSVCQCYHLDTLGRTDHESGSFVTERHSDNMQRSGRMPQLWKTKKIYSNLMAPAWSEMWRLPYWDPTRQLVVDAMHCIWKASLIIISILSLDWLISPQPANQRSRRHLRHRFTKVDPEDTPLPMKWLSKKPKQ